MPLLRCVAQFVSINEPHSAIYYAFKYHKGGNGADCSCVEQNSDVIRCLVEAGAKIPQHLVSECNVLQDFADMKDKAQSACMYFMLVHKSGRIPSLVLISKDVMRIILSRPCLGEPAHLPAFGETGTDDLAELKKNIESNGSAELFPRTYFCEGVS